MSSAIVRSRRLASLISSNLNNCRLCSSKSVDQSPSVLSSSSAGSVAVSASSAAADPTPSVGKKLFKFLKYGVGLTLTGASAAAGYATYAYSTDEFEEKTRSLRSLARNTVGDEGTALEKFQATMRSAAIAVPAKAAELYLDLRRLIDERVQEYTEPVSDKLLPDLHPTEKGVFTLVLDLNETLVYSDWQRDRGWRTFKRPGVDAFLEHLAKFYEIVLFSDQSSFYVEPIVQKLDPKGCIRYRLDRAATKYQNGKHYRDLSKLNRDPEKVIYLSAHALETSLQPENCLQIKPWTLQSDDTELLDLIPLLEYVATHRPADIRPVLASYKGQDVGKEFIKRLVEQQRQMQEQKTQGGRLWRRL